MTVSDFGHVAKILTNFLVTLVGKEKNEKGSSIMRDDHEGGTLVLYHVFSWITLRGYGALFCWIALQAWQMHEVGHPNLHALLLGLPDLPGIALIAIVGLYLFVPFLTPDFIRKPLSVRAGAAKALLLTIISIWLYFMLMGLLASGYLNISKQVALALPNFFKALAGTSITGAILVGFVSQMGRSAGKPRGAGQPSAPVNMLSLETLEDSASVNATSLRALRQSRM